MAHQVLKLLQKEQTTIVRCHKNSWIYLTSTYYWWLLRPTITIRFNSKWKKHYLHSTTIHTNKLHHIYHLPTAIFQTELSSSPPPTLHYLHTIFVANTFCVLFDIIPLSLSFVTLTDNVSIKCFNSAFLNRGRMTPNRATRPSLEGHEQIKLLKHIFYAYKLLCSLLIFSKTFSLPTLA